MRWTAKTLVVAAVLAVALAACTGPDEPARPTSVAAPGPVLADQHLRPVRMASGRALTFVQPETASQILCQILDKKSWERLLGGRVARKPLNGSNAGCQVATADVTYLVALREPWIQFRPNTTIAGRPAMGRENAPRSASTLVALTEDTRPAGMPNLQTLELSATGGDPEAVGDVALRLLTEIVPLLVRDGEPVPEINDYGRVPYVATPVTGGRDFVDLTQPVQALQLCGLLLEGLRIRPVADGVDASGGASCTLTTEQGRIEVSVVTPTERLGYHERIAGRPSNSTSNRSSTMLLLRDDSPIYLSVSAPDAVTLTEQIVPLLLG